MIEYTQNDRIVEPSGSAILFKHIYTKTDVMLTKTDVVSSKD